MGQLQDAFMDAAGEVANIKAQPSNRYWWLYGTIMKKNGNGTLDVKIDGLTIQQVKATVSCMMANVGDRVIVLKAGPLMTCVDVIATSDNAVIPASSLPTASETAKGIMQVGSGLTVSDGLVSVNNGAYVRQIDGWTVFMMGSLCVCSTVFTAGKNAYIGEAWGSVYSTSDTFNASDYPVAFKSPPASTFDYVGGDDGSSFAAFAYRNIPTATSKTAGEVWLMRPDRGVTIRHPKFAVLAMGLV